MIITSDNFVYKMSAENEAAASCKPGEVVDPKKTARMN
jgi:acetamidase/formamidase